MAKTIEQKLGFVDGMSVLVINAPADIALQIKDHGSGPRDFVLAFVTTSTELKAIAAQATQAYQAGGRLWIGYPKKSSGIKTDINRDHGWESLTTLGLLPVTQIAIDDTWSALRWRYRAEIPKLTRKTGL